MQDSTEAQPKVTTELNEVGGEILAGSGFEAETPETNFVSSDQRVEE